MQYCERPGSLDAHIKVETEAPNDFATLLADHPGIRAIGFNGKKSEQVFREKAQPAIPEDRLRALEFHSLPSTSPANASLTYEQKLDRWRVILAYLPA